MNEEEINVVKLHTLKRVVDGPENVLAAVKVVPDLCGDEDVGTLNGRVGLEEVTDSVTNLVLVEVEPGTVKVTVAGGKSSGDGSVGLAIGALASEGAEADGGHLHAIA